MVNVLDVLKKEKNQSKLYMLFDLSQKKELYFDLQLYFDVMFPLYITDNEKLKEVSPYLLEVDLNNKNQLEWLEENVVGEPIAIFFFSSKESELLATYFSSMATIWSGETDTHEAGEAYFAFYDPRVLKGFLLGLGEESNRFFEQIESVYGVDEFNKNILYNYKLDESKESIVEECIELQSNHKEQKLFNIEVSKRGFDFSQYSQPLLTNYMKQQLEANEEMRKVKKIAYQIEDAFQEYFAKNSITVLIEISRKSVNRMKSYGFSQYKYLYALASWEVFYGEKYEELDSKGELKSICLSKMSEEKKFEAFSNRLQSLKVEE